MTNIKKIDIVISEKEFSEISSITDKYELQINSDEYEYYFKFYKNRGSFNVGISITNKDNELIVTDEFYGTSDILSLFDKVYGLRFAKYDIKLFLKLDYKRPLKDAFLESLEVSKRIDSMGVIYLHNHISYTDFNNDIEVIKLCLKYTCFCYRIYSINSISNTNQFLDRNFNVINKLFQYKLEYYGYTSESEVKSIWDEPSKIAEKIKEIVTTKKLIKNKIVFLTQCFIYGFNGSKTVDDTMKVILDEAEKYADLL